jgi:predicted dehydrogenase
MIKSISYWSTKDGLANTHPIAEALGEAKADVFGFQMQYTVNFQNATVEFSFDGKDQVRLVEVGKEPRMIDVGDGMGYEHEIAYFLDSINKNVPPSTVTLSQAAESIRIVEAEARSITTSQIVNL